MHHAFQLLLYEAGGQFLFNFLALDHHLTECKHFNFNWLLHKLPFGSGSDEDLARLISTLLKAQIAVFGDWCDKLRSSNALDFANGSLPRELRLVNCAEKKYAM